MVSHKRLHRASEAAAIYVLEDLGYSVVDVRRPLIVGGVEVSDIDIVALKDNVYYAVEVKGGKADVGAIRQAYINALLAGMKPLVIARGVDDKAKAVAERLGVELIILPDLVIAGYEDLRLAVREALLSIIEETVDIIVKACKATGEDRRLLESIAESENIQELAEALGKTLEETAKTLASARKKGIIPGANYQSIRLAAKLALLLCQ